ncbi:MAG: alkaline phosphatase D family protein [Pseudomonadota bacterium]
MATSATTRARTSPSPFKTIASANALYKADPSLQRARAAFPLFAVLDNHDAPKNVPLSPEQEPQRRAAYQAWFEHMPMAGGYTLGSDTLVTHQGVVAAPRPLCGAVMSPNRQRMSHKVVGTVTAAPPNGQVRGG